MPKISERGVRAVSRSPLGAAGFSAMTTGSYATFLYQLDGKTFPVPTATLKYDTTVDTWTSVKRIPTGRSGGDNENALAATVGDAIYVCGGNGNAKLTVEAYYPLTDTWTAKQDMPQDHAGGVIGATATKIYVAGGVPSSSEKTLDIYDVATGVWTTGACPSMASVAAAVVTGSVCRYRHAEPPRRRRRSHEGQPVLRARRR